MKRPPIIRSHVVLYFQHAISSCPSATQVDARPHLAGSQRDEGFSSAEKSLPYLIFFSGQGPSTTPHLQPQPLQACTHARAKLKVRGLQEWEYLHGGCAITVLISIA
jgi:hypothetical protein